MWVRELTNLMVERSTLEYWALNIDYWIFYTLMAEKIFNNQRLIFNVQMKIAENLSGFSFFRRGFSLFLLPKSNFNIHYSLFLVRYSKRCGSSVGRAKDWKSLCRRFNPAPHHFNKIKPTTSVGFVIQCAAPFEEIIFSWYPVTE